MIPNAIPRVLTLFVFLAMADSAQAGWRNRRYVAQPVYRQAHPSYGSYTQPVYRPAPPTHYGTYSVTSSPSRDSTAPEPPAVPNYRHSSGRTTNYAPSTNYSGENTNYGPTTNYGGTNSNHSYTTNYGGTNSNYSYTTNYGGTNYNYSPHTTNKGGTNYGMIIERHVYDGELYLDYHNYNKLQPNTP